MMCCGTLRWVWRWSCVWASSQHFMWIVDPLPSVSIPAVIWLLRKQSSEYRIIGFINIPFIVNLSLSFTETFGWIYMWRGDIQTLLYLGFLLPTRETFFASVTCFSWSIWYCKNRLINEIIRKLMTLNLTELSFICSRRSHNVMILLPLKKNLNGTLDYMHYKTTEALMKLSETHRFER